MRHFLCALAGILAFCSASWGCHHSGTDDDGNSADPFPNGIPWVATPRDNPPTTPGGDGAVSTTESDGGPRPTGEEDDSGIPPPADEGNQPDSGGGEPNTDSGEGESNTDAGGSEPNTDSGRSEPDTPFTTCTIDIDGTACSAGSRCSRTAGCTRLTCSCVGGRWDCTEEERCDDSCPAPQDIRCGDDCNVEAIRCGCNMGGGNFSSCDCSGGEWRC